MHEGPMNAQEQDPHHYHHHQLTEVFYDVSQCPMPLDVCLSVSEQRERIQGKRIYAVRDSSLGVEILANTGRKRIRKGVQNYLYLQALRSIFWFPYTEPQILFLRRPIQTS